MTDPDAYGVTSSEARDLGNPRTPLDAALAEILRDSVLTLKHHGIPHHRIAILVDDLVHESDVDGSTSGGMVLSMPPGEAVEDVMALIFSHVMALAQTQDIPVAQIAANVMFGALPHRATAPEELAEIPDMLRAVCKGAGQRLLEDPVLPEGAPDMEHVDRDFRRAVGITLMSAAAVTFLECTRQLLRAAGAHDGEDGSAPPPGWPEGLQWGTD